MTWRELCDAVAEASERLGMDLGAWDVGVEGDGPASRIEALSESRTIWLGDG